MDGVRRLMSLSVPYQQRKEKSIYRNGLIGASYWISTNPAGQAQRPLSMESGRRRELIEITLALRTADTLRNGRE